MSSLNPTATLAWLKSKSDMETFLSGPNGKKMFDVAKFEPYRRYATRDVVIPPRVGTRLDESHFKHGEIISYPIPRHGDMLAKLTVRMDVQLPWGLPLDAPQAVASETAFATDADGYIPPHTTDGWHFANGTMISSSSYQATYSHVNVLDGNDATVWRSAAAYYTGAEPEIPLDRTYVYEGKYKGSTHTHDVNGQVHGGEWLQLQLSRPIRIKGMHVKTPQELSLRLFGSQTGQDGTWERIVQTNRTSDDDAVGAEYLEALSPTPYAFYRLVVVDVGAYQNDGYAEVTSWKLIQHFPSTPTPRVYPTDVEGYFPRGETLWTTYTDGWGFEQSKPHPDSEFLLTSSNQATSSGLPFVAFRNPPVPGDAWESLDMYIKSTGYPFCPDWYRESSFDTQATDGKVYRGEWLQIQMPAPTSLRAITFEHDILRRYSLLGSDTGLDGSWTEVHAADIAEIATSGFVTYTAEFDHNKSYTFYRLVLEKLDPLAGPDGSTYVAVRNLGFKQRTDATAAPGVHKALALRASEIAAKNVNLFHPLAGLLKLAQADLFIGNKPVQTLFGECAAAYDITRTGTFRDISIDETGLCTFLVDLPFDFFKTYRNALPMVKLTEHEAELRLRLNSNFAAALDAPSNAYAHGMGELKNVTLLGRYIFLAPEERVEVLGQPVYQRIFEEWSEFKIPIEGPKGVRRVSLPFRGPVSSLYFRFVNPDHPAGTLFDVPMKTIGMALNNSYVIDPQPPAFFQNHASVEHHLNPMPVRTLLEGYFVHFDTNGNAEVPDGHIDLSAFDRVEFVFDFKEQVPDATYLHVYARGWNVLVIRDGMGGKMFSR